MSYIILLFGGMIFIIGVIIIIRPDSIFDFVRNNSESFGLHVTAVFTRLILGVALISYASSSQYPLILEIIGWVSFAAAMILGGMGRTNFKKFIAWSLSFSSHFVGRVGGIFALLFGGFLIYAVR